MPRLTYHDLVESLVVQSFGGALDAEQRDIRTAVHRAYDELTTIRDWNYYSTHGRIVTDEPYSTGTVTTSGTTATLTGGTWPSWAANGHLQIADTICPVASRTSDSVIVLSLAPAEAVTGVTYTLYRVDYVLPTDFKNLDTPSAVNTWSSGVYISPDEAMKLERLSLSSGGPYHWTILKDASTNGWSMRLYGYPSGIETIDFIYRRTARALRFSGHEANSRVGTISRTGTAITGSSTAFTAAMVGSILRVGDTTNYPGSIESLTPWVEESVITARSSATAITTQDSGTIASSTRYIVTDPIDVAPHMHTVMDSCAKYWLAKIRGQDTEKLFAFYRRDLELAGEREELAPISGRSDRICSDNWTRGDDEG